MLTKINNTRKSDLKIQQVAHQCTLLVKYPVTLVEHLWSAMAYGQNANFLGAKNNTMTLDSCYFPSASEELYCSHFCVMTLRGNRVCYNPNQHMAKRSN